MKNIISKRRLSLAKSTFLLWMILCLGGGACTQQSPIDVQYIPAFYHWKTKFALSAPQIQYLDNYQVDHLYLRFFDVDRQGGTGIPIPVATTQIDTVGCQARNLIPVVFITNRTLQDLTEVEVDTLAARIVKKLDGQWERLGLEQPFNEFQVDCDWTNGTRPTYFRLLAQIDQQLSESVLLSATIRLHQIKYFQKTGVPPVDRGMLMYYNMGEVSQWETDHSILDTTIAQQYLYNFDRYPLSLDVALPIFSWGAVFRDDRLVQLIHQLEESNLLDTTRFDRLSDDRFVVKKGTYLEGFYCYPEDQIRLEEIVTEQLIAASRQLQTHLPPEDRRVVFYHLHDKLDPNDDLWRQW